MKSGGCQPMRGGVVRLVDILENGLDPGVKVLVRAALGGIKARSPGPLSLTKDRGGLNTGGEPSPQRRSAEAASKKPDGVCTGNRNDGWDWRGFGQGTWYLTEDVCYNSGSSRMAFKKGGGWMPR